MKNKYAVLLLIAFSCVAACTKEQLKVIDQPIEINEKDPEYQVFLEERIREYIKLYRFEKAAPFLAGVADPQTKAVLMKEFEDTRNEARLQGFGFIIQSGDTLFYRNPGTSGDPKLVKQLYISFYSRGTYKINVPGKFYGLERYPNLETLSFSDCLATEVVGLDKLKKLSSFTWSMDVTNMKEVWELEAIEPASIKLNFSSNPELNNLKLQNVRLTNNIKFPDHQIEKININGIINVDDALDNIRAISAELFGTSDRKEFVVKSPKIDNLNLSLSNEITTADFSASKIERLSLRAKPQKIRLNDGLKVVESLNGGSLVEKIAFPTSIETLNIANYTIENDLTSLAQLVDLRLAFNTDNDHKGGHVIHDLSKLKLPSSAKNVILSTSGYYKFDVDGFTLPQSVETVKFDIARINSGVLDLSYLNNLKEFNAYILVLENGNLKLPKSLEKINFSSTSLNLTALDLGQLTNLKALSLGTLGLDSYPFNPDAGKPVKLTLPINLSESVFSSWNSTSKPIAMRTGSTIINKPSWFDKYVWYYN